MRELRTEAQNTDPADATREIDDPEERPQLARGHQPVSPHPSPSLDALALDPCGAVTLSPDLVRVLLARCGVVQNALIGRLVAVPDGPVSGTEDRDRLLPVPVVAKVLAVPASYAYELARQGKLPTVRLGKYVRVRASALAAWLDGRDTGGLDGAASEGSLGQIRTAARAIAATPKRRGRSTLALRRGPWSPRAPGSRQRLGGASSPPTVPSGAGSDDA